MRSLERSLGHVGLIVNSYSRFSLFLFLPQFFNQVLMLGKTSVSDLSEHVFDLILELYNIDSHLLLSVLPQLEFKLKVKKALKHISICHITLFV